MLSASSTAHGLSEQPNFERKYVFPASQGESLGDWLSASLIQDSVFPVGGVTSLYFDTPRLELYRQKRNSDYLKTKVRLRWYETPIPSPGPVACFMEIKRKIGALRTKVRVKLDLPTHVLAHGLFTDRAISEAPTLADPGLGGLPLVPMFLVQYRRLRFVDPVTGIRVALDTAVRCSTANPAFLPRTDCVWLSVGVLETKGAIRELPMTMAPIAGRLRREAFSKYAQCCEQMMQPLGRRV